MTKRYPRSFHCGPRTVEQINELATLFGGNKSEVIRMSVDRMWLAEIGNEQQMQLEAEADGLAEDARAEEAALARDTWPMQTIQTLEELAEISDADLWAQFAGDLTPEDAATWYTCPQDFDVAGTDWVADRDVAEAVNERLWAIVSDAIGR